jgi:hypothetical protein
MVDFPRGKTLGELVGGYNASGQVHALPEHCVYLTKRLLEMEVIE